MSLTRQERRRKERQEYKDKRKRGKETYELSLQLLQPWSTPILKTKLPPKILQTMIEISDIMVADKEAKSWGHNLAGQIERELIVDHDILHQTGVMEFFLGTVREYVIQCKCQLAPFESEAIRKEEWLTQMLSMWIISQQPGEYNPAHIHTQCDISTVMYLRVPEILPSRKIQRQSDDGSICFISPACRDMTLSNPQLTIFPEVGDFYIFGAQQQHFVYPYRCKEGQEEVERRSISFNAIFTSRSAYDKQQAKSKEEQELNFKESQGKGRI